MIIDLTLSLGLNKVAPGTKISIIKNNIIGLTESQTMGVIVVCSGGVSLPVKETKLEVLNLLMGTEEMEKVNGR